MTEESCRKRLCDEGTCPICMNYFTDPVTLDCGHNFCSTCIDRVIIHISPHRRLECPLCTEVVQRKMLRPNSQLANMLEVVQDLSNLLKHRSECSVEEAEKEFAKDQITRALGVLRNERIKLLDYKDREEIKSEEFHKQTKTDREKTTAAFRQLHEFLNEQEKHFLAQTKAVETEAERLWNKHLAIISEELSSLDSLIKKLEGKLKKSSKELLQHSGDILERILACLDADLRLYLSTRCKKEKLCKNSLVFPIALAWQNHDCSDISSFLVGIMNQFKESLVSGLQLQEANVKLDPDTAHPSLILSEDCKSVRWTYERQDLPNNPKRFIDSPYVLGQKGFTAGRHFWEVVVSNEEKWSVGIAMKSVKRKDPDAENILEMSMQNGEYKISIFSHDVPVYPSQELKKIRVTVNYAGREVGFFDADTGSELALCSNFPFDGEMLLPCFNVSKRGHLTLCPGANQ